MGYHENIFTENELIENCTFKSNQGYSGYAIYINTNDDKILSVTIDNNSFIDNFDLETLDLKSLLYKSENCNTNNVDFIEKKYFSNKLNGRDLNVKKLSCYDEPISNRFSMSTDSDEMNLNSNTFTENIQFTLTDQISSSQIDDFTQTETIPAQSAPINTKSQKLIGILFGSISVLFLVLEVIVITVKRKDLLHVENLSSVEEDKSQIFK